MLRWRTYVLQLPDRNAVNQHISGGQLMQATCRRCRAPQNLGFQANVTTLRSPYGMSRPSVVCRLSSVTLVHYTQRVEIATSNNLATGTVCTKIFGKHSRGSRWLCKLNGRGYEKLALRLISQFISKTVYKIRLMANQYSKSYVVYRSAPFSVIVNNSLTEISRSRQHSTLNGTYLQ